MTVLIREANQADLDSLLEIEQQAQIKPWTPTHFLECLNGNYKVFVLRAVEEVIGYIILSIIVPEAEILNIAIKLQQQQKGYGYRLLQFALQYVHDNAVNQVFLEVRRSNLAAIACYEKIGFQKIAERKNYYIDEDALIYRKNLNL